MNSVRATIGKRRILEFEADFLLAQSRAPNGCVTAYGGIVVYQGGRRGRDEDRPNVAFSSYCWDSSQTAPKEVPSRTCITGWKRRWTFCPLWATTFV